MFKTFDTPSENLLLGAGRPTIDPTSNPSELRCCLFATHRSFCSVHSKRRATRFFDNKYNSLQTHTQNHVGEIGTLARQFFSLRTALVQCFFIASIECEKRSVIRRIFLNRKIERMFFAQRRCKRRHERWLSPGESRALLEQHTIDGSKRVRNPGTYMLPSLLLCAGRPS
jgi:hypothetical protein